MAGCGQNDVDIHLFEVMEPGEYIYCGRIELVSKPYVDIQTDIDGNDRKVWIFPIRPVPENNVKKPNIFVFKDMNDYKARGKNVDAEYVKLFAKQKKSGRKRVSKQQTPISIVPPTTPKPIVVVPADIIGKQVKHKAYGVGTIIRITGAVIIVLFDDVGEKKLGYEVCVKNKLIEII